MMTVEKLWQEILDKDDRTSPAEYPDMALITFDEFREAIAALSRVQEPVAVKPLEWSEEYDEYDVCALVCYPVRYEIFHQAVDIDERGFQLCDNRGILGFHPSLDEAKAAAQADYERRIVAALATPPAQGDAAKPAADVAEHYRLAMLDAERVLSAIPAQAAPLGTPVAINQTAVEISRAQGILHQARHDVIFKAPLRSLATSPAASQEGGDQ